MNSKATEDLNEKKYKVVELDEDESWAREANSYVGFRYYYDLYLLYAFSVNIYHLYWHLLFSLALASS